MNITISCLILAVALFFVSFINKHRFGLLGLALAAGAFLSEIWVYEVGLIVGGIGLPSSMTTTLVIKILLILLPPFVLLFSGHKYKTIIGRLFGSALFTLLAFGFMIDPLSKAVMPQGISADIFRILIDNRTFIIGLGLIAAILDIFFTKKPVQSLNKDHKS